VITVLVDDSRSFRDERLCMVARSSRAGVTLLRDLHHTRIDALWLDHDLTGDDTIWPVIGVLEHAAEVGHPYDIGLIHLHALHNRHAHEMAVALEAAGYATERSISPTIWRH
jgi:hypothetical protein